MQHLLAHSTLEDLASIHIVLLPVGKWRPAVYPQVCKEFTDLAQHISRRALPAKSNIATAVKSSSASSSPIRHPSSASFIRCTPVVLQPLAQADASQDEALNALLRQFFSHQHPEYEELHVYKRLMAVVAVIDCQSDALEPAYQLYTRVKEKLRHSSSNSADSKHGFPPLRYQCYGFDSKSDVAVQGAGDLAMMHSDQLAYYLQPNINELVSTLLYDFERMSTSLASHSWLKTPLDSNLTVLAINSVKEMNTVISNQNGDDSGKATTQQNNQTMVGSNGTSQVPLLANSGRQAKYVADLCLLAGSWKDAQKQYKRAIDIATQTKDSLWHAAALEGQAAATLAKQLEKSSYGTKATVDEIIDLYSQALGRYAQLLPATATLLVQASSRLMMYLTRICSNSHGVASRTNEINHLLMICYDAVTCIPSGSDRAHVLRHLVNICNTIHFHRKASFMLMQAAKYQHEEDHITDAHNSLLTVLHHYGVCLCRPAHQSIHEHGHHHPHSRSSSLNQSGHDDLDHVNGSAVSDTSDNHIHTSHTNGHTDPVSNSPNNTTAASIHSQQPCEHLRSCQWQFLQTHIVEDLIECAKQLGLTDNVRRYVLHQLVSTQAETTAEQQQQLVDKIVGVSPELSGGDTALLDVTTLNLIQSIAVTSNSSTTHMPVTRSAHQRRISAPTSPTTVNLFEFHPNADNRPRVASSAVPADAVCTTAEEINIALSLSNQYKVSFDLTDLQLLYGDIIKPHVSHTISLAAQSNDSCTLTTHTSSSAGYIAIKSASFTLFNAKMFTYLPQPYIVQVSEPALQ